MKKHMCIVGIGFGDECKGLVTSYLCNKYKNNTLVIRHSGGQQAGHTVVKQDGTRHVFSNFGSGTLDHIPTYWSKFCTIDPVGIYNEHQILKSIKDVNPVLYIDSKCPVTTPYDKFYNQLKDMNNGTCGVGYGSTLQREEDHYSLTYFDLLFKDVLKTKMSLIRNYYINKIKNYINIIDIEKEIEYFYRCCDYISDMKNNFIISNGIPNGYNNIIFEGSQGLLLDQNNGFFPHVTRSNTGPDNVYKIIGEDKQLELFLVTRAYQTRHGNGPMSNIDKPHNIKLDVNETNVSNKYQGEFKIGLLDVDLLQYAIMKNDYIQKSYDINLVITCLDQIQNEYRFTYRGEILSFDNEYNFISEISNILNINNIYMSRTPYSNKIEKFIKINC